MKFKIFFIKENIQPVYIVFFISRIPIIIFLKIKSILLIRLLSLIFFSMILIKENLFFIKSRIIKKHFYTNSFVYFILSELIIFISFFWSNFYIKFSFNINNSFDWPPRGLEESDIKGLIIFGTSILLTSRLILTLRHLKIVKKTNVILFIWIYIINIFIGLTFLDIQSIELAIFFFKLKFSINDRFFRRIFIITICLHSIHVLIGVIILTTILIVEKMYIFSSNIVIGIDLTSWYWHFVDYIWILVFSIFYIINKR